MAQRLTLQFHYHFNYAVGCFIGLERLFEESKESYDETLEASSEGWYDGAHNSVPWMDYFRGAVLRAYSKWQSKCWPWLS